MGVRYAHTAGGAWQLETVGSAGWFTSLALDPAGQPHMVYSDTAGHSLAYARRDAAGWGLQAVDRLADAGSFNALWPLDAAGVPAAAYYEAGHGDLRVRPAVRLAMADRDRGCRRRRRAMSACTRTSPWTARAGLSSVTTTRRTAISSWRGRPPAQWQVETVDSGGDGVSVDGDGIDSDVGRYTALALDAGGSGAASAWISYYDATHGDLKLAQHDRRPVAHGGGRCSAGDVGRYTSLALDGGRPAWIAYYDATRRCSESGAPG